MTLGEIEAEVRHLTKAEQAELFGWLGNLLEDELIFTDEFKIKIKCGEADFRDKL